MTQTCKYREAIQVYHFVINALQPLPFHQLLVASEETLRGAYKVNQLRQQKGLGILDIHPISLIGDSHATAEEEDKISSSSLRKRLLGTRLRPPKVYLYCCFYLSFL